MIFLQAFKIIVRIFLYIGLFLAFANGSFSYAQTDSIAPIHKSDSLLIDSSQVVKLDTLPKVNKQVEEILKFAKKFLGTPYHYAGTTPSGFDCSGFIYYVLGNFGIRLSRSSYGMAEYGKTVKLSELQPGDLMFFKGSNVRSTSVGHVGMVLDVKDGIIRFIHSSNGKGVGIDVFNSSRYYVPRYIKSKRLDYGGVVPKK